MMRNRVLYIITSALVATFIIVTGVNEIIRASDAAITKQKAYIANLEKQLESGEREIATLRKSKADTEKRVESLVRQIETRNRLLTAQRNEEQQ